MDWALEELRTELPGEPGGTSNFEADQAAMFRILDSLHQHKYTERHYSGRLSDAVQESRRAQLL